MTVCALEAETLAVIIAEAVRWGDSDRCARERAAEELGISYADYIARAVIHAAQHIQEVMP